MERKSTILALALLLYGGVLMAIIFLSFALNRDLSGYGMVWIFVGWFVVLIPACVLMNRREKW